MRYFILFPTLKTPEEAALFFRAGWLRYTFPRFLFWAVFMWLSIPATDSLWHLTPTFTIRWIDLPEDIIVLTIISVPVWFGYKQTYREWLPESSKNEKNRLA